MTLFKAHSATAKFALPFRASASDVGNRSAPDTTDTLGEADRQAQQLASLRANITELETKLDDMQARQREECAEAFERGRTEGLALAESREAERLVLLNDSLGNFVREVSDRIDRDRDLAIDIARAAIARVVANPELYHGLVTETARRNAANLLQSTLIRLRVSPTDFPDTEALAMLPALGAHVGVEADPALDAGACIFDLSLGSLDASIPRQFVAIENALDQASRKAGSA